MLAAVRAAGLPEPEREYPFAPGRRWRADFAWPAHRLLVECEGLGGRHQRAAGYIADCRKYNAAVLLGWRLLRFTHHDLRDGTAIRQIAAALGCQTGPES